MLKIQTNTADVNYTNLQNTKNMYSKQQKSWKLKNIQDLLKAVHTFHIQNSAQLKGILTSWAQLHYIQNVSPPQLPTCSIVYLNHPIL
jgi:hypothetical protein